MNESFENLNQNNDAKKGITRRDFLKGAGAAIGVLLSSAYNTGPNKNKPRPPSNIKPPEAVPTPPSLEIVPEKITVSKIKESFFPPSDSATMGYYEISFIVELQVNNEQSMNVSFSFGDYVEKKELSKTNKKIIDGRKFYETLKKINPKEVSVAFRNNKISKISTTEKILWESVKN